MFCQNCGNKNQNIAIFCKNCGYRIVAHSLTADSSVSTPTTQPKKEFLILGLVKGVLGFVGEIITSIIVSIITLLAIGWVVMHYFSTP